MVCCPRELARIGLWVDPVHLASVARPSMVRAAVDSGPGKTSRVLLVEVIAKY